MELTMSDIQGVRSKSIIWGRYLSGSGLQESPLGWTLSRTSLE
jgi:hypothetical protein